MIQIEELRDESKKHPIPKLTDTGKLEREMQERAVQTVKLLAKTFSEDDLRELCMDFHLEFEDIAGDTRRTKIVYLVDYFVKRNTLDILVGWCAGQRPNEQWPEA